MISNRNNDSIITLINNNDWTKAKFLWLDECVEMQPNMYDQYKRRLSRKEYDCFGSVFEYFIKKFQSIQMHYTHKECNYDASNWSLQFKKKIVFESLTINQLTTRLTSLCDKCDSKSIEYLEFLNEPNWLICENINQSDIVTIDSLIK